MKRINNPIIPIKLYPIILAEVGSALGSALGSTGPSGAGVGTGSFTV